MTEQEEREYVAKARAEGKTASVTRGTTTACYHPNGCVVMFEDDRSPPTRIDYSSITREIAHDNTTD